MRKRRRGVRELHRGVRGLRHDARGCHDVRDRHGEKVHDRDDVRDNLHGRDD